VEVDQDVCCPKIYNCTEYADTCEGGCLKLCDEGQTESEGNVCVDELDDCANYEDNGECKFCDTGFQKAVDDGKQCVTEIDHCIEHHSTNGCQTCDSNFEVVTDYANEAKCVKKIDNCAD